MQDAPDFDAIRAHHIKHQEGKLPYLPEAQSGQIQFLCIAGRTGGGMPGDLPEGSLQGLHEGDGGLFPRNLSIVPDGIRDIAVGG